VSSCGLSAAVGGVSHGAGSYFGFAFICTDCRNGHLVPAARSYRVLHCPERWCPRLYSDVHPRGRQASTWSIRGGGCESRSREASLNTRETISANRSDSHAFGLAV